MEAKEKLLKELIEDRHLYEGKSCPFYLSTEEMDILIKSLQSSEWVSVDRIQISDIQTQYEVQTKLQCLDNKGNFTIEYVQYLQDVIIGRTKLLTPPNR